MANPYECVTRRNVAPIDTSRYNQTVSVTMQQPKPLTTVSNPSSTSDRNCALFNICENFCLPTQHQATQTTQTDGTTETLIGTLVSLSTSRTTEYQLNRRLDQLYRSRLLKSSTTVEERLFKLQRLQQSINAVLNQPTMYVNRLHFKMVEGIAVPLVYQPHVHEIFHLLEELIATDDIQAVRWSQDSSKHQTTCAVRNDLQNIIPKYVNEMKRWCTNTKC